jgi:hypothetical protein
MYACRGTPFSATPVICELYLFHSERYRSSGILIHRKILVLLAAGGVPVAVKRRVVNRSAKIRTSLYKWWNGRDFLAFASVILSNRGLVYEPSA